MTRIIGLALALFLSTAQLQQQQPLPPGTAAVSGVVEALGGAPLPGATVQMLRIQCNNFAGAPEVLTSTTDANGKFAFKEVRAGNWCLGATIAGGKYSPVEYQQRGYKGRGATITIADGQTLENLRLSMPQTGTISGRVLNAEGEAMGHVRVHAMEAFYQYGQRRLYTLNVVQTNDLGEFSLFWLPPGEYFVAAMIEDPDRPDVVFSVAPPGMGGRRADAMPPVITRRIQETGELVEEVSKPVYYGGLDTASATPIRVEPGATAKIDLSFAGATSRAWHIRGKVVSATNGQGVANAQLRLAPRDWTATVVMPHASADANGDFDIAGVAPGAYVLYASGSVQQAPAPGTPPPLMPDFVGVQIVGRIPLEMGSSNIDNLGVTVAPPFAFSGRFILEGIATSIPATVLRSVRITLTREPDVLGPQQLIATSTVPALPAANAGNAPAAVDPNVFRFQGVAPGTYRAHASSLFPAFQWGMPTILTDLQNVYVKSIRLGATDVLADGLHISTAPEYPMEVVLAGGGRLSGLAVNDRMEPSASSIVALVPDAGRRQRPDLYRTSRTDAAGKFRIQGIAPGDYKVFIWEDVVDGAWQSVDFVRSYEQFGKPVHISLDSEAKEDVVVIPARR